MADAAPIVSGRLDGPGPPRGLGPTHLILPNPAMATPMKLEKPIFLLASERSGSNLIRVICGSHPAIAAPPPPHLLMTFLPELPAYGDLSTEGSFRRLCRDVATVMDHQLGSWHDSPSAEELFQEVSDRSFMAVFDRVYDREREAAGAQRVFFKEN